jgi:hypothetical protein
MDAISEIIEDLLHGMRRPPAWSIVAFGAIAGIVLGFIWP